MDGDSTKIKMNHKNNSLNKPNILKSTKINNF